MALAAVLFVVVFLLILVCVAFGLSFFKSREKQRIRAMLRKAEETPTISEPRPELLRPAEVQDALAKLFSKFEFTQKLDLILEQAGKNWSSSKLLSISAVAAVIGFVLGWKIRLISPPASAAVLGVLGAILPTLSVLRKRSKMISAFEEQLPEALDFLSRSMRAGHGFTIALEMLAADASDPLGSAFRRVSNDLQLGSSLEVAMQKLVVTVPLIDVRFFVSSVLLQQETGGNLGEILSKLALIIRERFRLKGQVKAASAHGRITGLVLVLMPVAVAVFMMIATPSYLKGMMAVKTGRMMVYGAMVGQVIGYFVIKKIVNIKV